MTKTLQNNQHTVYTTSIESVINSSSAASSKQLSMRTSDNSLNMSKSKKSRENCSTADLDDYYDDLSDVR